MPVLEINKIGFDISLIIPDKKSGGFMYLGDCNGRQMGRKTGKVPEEDEKMVVIKELYCYNSYMIQEEN